MTALARRSFVDSRVRSASFAALLALVAYANVTGYRQSYATPADRLAHAFGANEAARLLYGEPRDLLTTGGYTLWHVGGRSPCSPPHGPSSPRSERWRRRRTPTARSSSCPRRSAGRRRCRQRSASRRCSRRPSRACAVGPARPRDRARARRGSFAWLGATSKGARVGLADRLAGPANCPPAALLFLGLAALAAGAALVLFRRRDLAGA